MSAIVVGIGVLSSVLASHARPPGDFVARVADAVGSHRVVRARLTGGYAYAPCRTPGVVDSLVGRLTCVEEPPSKWAELSALDGVAARLRAASTTQLSTAQRHHAVGAWSIIWGKPEAAVEQLGEAARAEPKNAAIQIDLAVALLQRAAVGQNPVDILAAYVANDSAIALDPKRDEALFNRALILEQLQLRESARAQWAAYLAVDRNSGWAGEARERLAALDAPTPRWADVRTRLRHAVDVGDAALIEAVVNQFPWRVRDEVRAALPVWAVAYSGNEARADSIAQATLRLAKALARATRDELWLDIANDIVEASRGADRARAQRIARGILAYDLGRSQLNRLEVDSAKSALDHAYTLLTSARNAAAHVAAYDRARASYQSHSVAAYADAVSRYRSVVAATPPTYRWLQALATRNVGFIGFLQGKFDLAASSFSEAIAHADGLGEPELELRTRTDAARFAATIRGDSVAWNEAYAAFKELPKFPDSPRDAQRVFGVGAVLSWRRFPTVARLFQAEVVRLTSSFNDSLLVMSALIREAELLSYERQPEEALGSLRRAQAYAAGVHSDSIKAVMSADADLVHGQVWLQTRPDSAVRVLRDVVDRYDKTQYIAQAGRAKLLLADAYLNAGRIDSARVAFDGALSTIEQARAGIASTDDRARFLDEARPVIDSVLTFHLNQSDTLAALDFFERMRARVLLERSRQITPNASGRSRSIGVVRRGLDSATSILSYAVMDREVVGWLVRRDGVWMRRVATSDSLRLLADRFARLMERGAGGGETEAVSARLRDLLTAPFEPRIPPGSSVIVVPDKWLHFVPFAALFDARSETFLVQKYALAMAPSIELFTGAALRSRALGVEATPSVLAVGNPAFDRSANALPPLPGAEREAREVSRRYSRVRLLIGKEATRRAFLDDARNANVIHFAGHGVVSLDAPMLSQLVLAPDARGENGGALYAKDLFMMSLPNTRLAVLSGCQTAGGGLSATEGVSSLARSLLAAGVPAVVASLWAVDDDATATFFAAFHDDFARTGEPGGALRRTQIDWIKRGDPWGTARTWAAFQLFGTVDVRRATRARESPPGKPRGATVQ